MYQGNVEFDIWGMSSADRDLLADAIIEVLAMVEVSAAGQRFLDRFYTSLQSTPYGMWHFPTLNLDQITGTGEPQPQPAPWGAEDQLVYETGYRVPIFGEFYSYTPPQPPTGGLVTEVDVYEYPVGADNKTPIDPTAPAPPVDPSKYDKFTGNPPAGQPGSEDI
jgi:hypothetical protein